ncbi:MAG: cytochrome c [Sneathiella sp.]|nr:cytochrome c [Sneathiella sp.]
MKKISTLIIAATMAIGTTAAIAHDGSTGNADADKRIMKMKELGGAMKAVAAVAKGEAAYTPALNEQAAKIKMIAAEMGNLFPEGSGGEKTRSKDEIWSQPEAFEKAVADFDMAATGLVAAVETGDQGKIGAALGATGKTCGGCHKPFRAPKD